MSEISPFSEEKAKKIVGQATIPVNSKSLSSISNRSSTTNTS